MTRLLFSFAAICVAACGDNLDPPVGEIPEVTPGCREVAGNLDTFTDPSELGPLVEGTLAGWDPDGRWFLTGTRVGGVSSFHFERRGLQVVVDKDPEYLGALDDDTLLQRKLAMTGNGDVYYVTARISNLRDDGTARAERAVCFPDGCTVCTAKLERATRFANEAEGDHLSLVSEFKGTTWDAGFTFNVRLAGTIAYVIRQDGLHIVETADPAHPVERGLWKRTGDGYSNDVKIVEANSKRYALIADSPVDIVDVTDPTMPRLVGQIPVEAHTLFTEARGGKQYVYFGAYNGTTPVYEITDPEVPVKRGAYDAKASIVHDLMVDNGIAYLNAWEQGLHVVDFTTPATPTLVGKWLQTPTHTSHSSWSVNVGGHHYALHGEETYGAHLDLVDVEPGSSKFMTSVGAYKTRDLVSIHNVMAIGTKAYMTYYQDGIRVLDVADPTHPKQIGYYNTWDPQAAYTSSRFFEGAVGLDIDVARKLVVVADSPRGLLILRDDTN